MANSKYENIWQLLSTYDFKDEIPNKFHCFLCKNIVIEPFGSLCGCRYCYGCITHYLKDGKIHCPGKNTRCIEEMLEMNVNVSRDLVLIQRITEIIVECPNDKCEVRCVLENMGDHLRICCMSTNKCPYEIMGCQLGQISCENLKTHYDDQWITHSQLMVEAFNNLRNEFHGLKVIVELRDKEIIKLNEDYERNEIMIKEMKKQINDERNDIYFLKQKNKRKDEEMEVLKEEIRKMIETKKKAMVEDFANVKKDKDKNDLDTNINEIKQQINDQRREIEELTVKGERRDREMEVMIETQKKTMMEELKNIKKDIEEMGVRGDIKDPNKTLNNLKMNQEYIERKINSEILSRIYDERQFIWRVDNFSKMKDEGQRRRIILWRYSLKLYLSLWCEGGYLRFIWKILKGEFDDDIKWPMKHKIALSMINQDTMKVHKSREFHFESSEGDKSAFDKPKDECNDIKEFGDLSEFFDLKDFRPLVFKGQKYNVKKPKNEWNNYSFGDLRFTTVKDLTDSPELILNDSLIVSFNIDY